MDEADANEQAESARNSIRTAAIRHDACLSIGVTTDPVATVDAAPVARSEYVDLVPPLDRGNSAREPANAVLTPICRACRARSGEIILDLGDQPSTDYFPQATDTTSDPRHPLRLWLCTACGLAQLPDEVAVPVEPNGVASEMRSAHAADAVAKIAAAGVLPAGARVTEFGSGHAASWLPHLAGRGLVPVTRGEADRDPVDVVVDGFALTHSVDQTAALAERVHRLAPGGILLLQYHSLATIVRNGQWNMVRHGHFAYHSTEAMTGMLDVAGLAPVHAWRFDLYGGTVVLGARRDGTPDRAVTALLDEENGSGVRDPALAKTLHHQAQRSADGLRAWLEGAAESGRAVVGYGAAARAVVLLNRAGVDSDLLPAVVDSSAQKWGKRIPGTRIPVISPAELAPARPDSVLVFVPELLAELRAAHRDLSTEWRIAR